MDCSPVESQWGRIKWGARPLLESGSRGGLWLWDLWHPKRELPCLLHPHLCFLLLFSLFPFPLFLFFHIHRHSCLLWPSFVGSSLMAPWAWVGWSEPVPLVWSVVEAKCDVWIHFIKGKVFQQVGRRYLKHCYGTWLILHKAVPPRGLVLSSSCHTTHSRLGSYRDLHWRSDLPTSHLSFPSHYDSSTLSHFLRAFSGKDQFWLARHFEAKVWMANRLDISMSEKFTF